MPVKKEGDLSPLEEKKLNHAVNKAKLDILAERNDDDDIKAWYRENGSKRFKCKITSTRKGEKTFELMCERPENPNKPKLVRGKLGVWLNDGLPMYVLNRLQEAFDSTAEELDERQMTGDSGRIFSQGRIPRYNVQIGEEVKIA